MTTAIFTALTALATAFFGSTGGSGAPHGGVLVGVAVGIARIISPTTGENPSGAPRSLRVGFRVYHPLRLFLRFSERRARAAGIAVSALAV